MHQMLGIRKVLEGINTLRACFVLFIYDKSSFGIFVFRQVAPTTRRSVGWAVDMFSSRLVLPVSLERLACPPSREVRDAVERSNANVLAFLLLEVDLEAMPRSADERLVEALAPLRTKLDMIIDMLGRLSPRRRAATAIRHRAQFYPDCLAFLSSTATRRLVAHQTLFSSAVSRTGRCCLAM